MLEMMSLPQEYQINFVESEYPSRNEFTKRYQVISTIGFGGQARVKEAFDVITKETVALKIFKKNSMSLFALNAANYEHSIMKQFDHPNILKTKAYFEDTEYLIIVYELLSSDLRALLVELKAPLAEIQIKDMFYQMLKAIEYCHEKNIVHRDIKMENFLLDSN